MSPPGRGAKAKATRAGPLGHFKGRLSAPPRRSEPYRIAMAFGLATVVLALVPLINAAPAPRVSGSAPDFSMTTTTGSAYRLSSDLGSLPILVEFLHPDCSHCRSMGPVLEQAHADFGARVRFVSVAIRLPGFTDPTLATVTAFAGEYGHSWTYGLDQQTTARDLYHIQGTPTFFFIAKNGTITRTVAGEMNAPELQGLLSALVGG